MDGGRMLKNVGIPLFAAVAVFLVIFLWPQSSPQVVPALRPVQASVPAGGPDNTPASKPNGMPASAPESTPADTTDPAAPIWSGGEDNAEGHWRKHGDQFRQFHSEQDYVDGAHAFVSHPPAGTLTKHRDNGDTLYFDPASGTFAVQAPNGAPRTMFKPDDGTAYWERQR